VLTGRNERIDLCAAEQNAITEQWILQWDEFALFA
jgi:hypothetical protein